MFINVYAMPELEMEGSDGNSQAVKPKFNVVKLGPCTLLPLEKGRDEVHIKILT